MFSKFFIEHPRFSMIVSIVITLAGVAVVSGGARARSFAHDSRQEFDYGSYGSLDF